LSTAQYGYIILAMPINPAWSTLLLQIDPNLHALLRETAAAQGISVRNVVETTLQWAAQTDQLQSGPPKRRGRPWPKAEKPTPATLESVPITETDAETLEKLLGVYPDARELADFRRQTMLDQAYACVRVERPLFSWLQPHEQAIRDQHTARISQPTVPA
jgi:hypothetical protein